MDNLEKQKIINLLSSGDLKNMSLAFQLIESLGILFDWEQYEKIAAWLNKGNETILTAWEEEDRGFSDREEAVITVYTRTAYGVQQMKLTTWDERICLLPNLEALNYRSNCFETIPESIQQLKKLKHLNLNRNRLTIIGAELDKSYHLEYLALGHNQIYAIHTDFKRLKGLRYLDLSGNKLAELPSSIGSLLALKQLNLNQNPLTILPNSIYNLTQLEKLYLLNTQIDEEIISDLASQLPNCQILYSKN